MKRFILTIIVIALIIYAGLMLKEWFFGSGNETATDTEVAGLIKSGKLHNGDIIFHTSESPLSKAIQTVTKSPYHN